MDLKSADIFWHAYQQKNKIYCRIKMNLFICYIHVDGKLNKFITNYENSKNWLQSITVQAYLLAFTMILYKTN